MTSRRGRQHLHPDLCPTLFWLQIRRALQQLLFPSKAFSWPRHVAIALILLVLVNVLVIYVPTIRDIFGVIGQYLNPSPHLIWALYLKLTLTPIPPDCPPGSTSAPSLIFILPSVFYLRIVPSEVESLSSWPKIQVRFPGEGCERVDVLRREHSKMARDRRNIFERGLGEEGASRKRGG